MEIRYTKDAVKFLGKQTKSSTQRIREAIAKLTLSPPEGDIALMKGYSDGRKRLRLGSWRIIFRYTTENQVEILLILDIGNRGDVYTKS